MKNRYSINNSNQLIVKPPRSKVALPVNGSFNIADDNRLGYGLNETPTWRKQYALPPRIVFKGAWSLNLNHDLVLTLDKNENQFQGDILIIKGNIILGDTDILAFQVKSYDRDGLLHVRILKLNITLFADESNRLCFKVKKIQPDILTLEGSWQLNDNQQIIYEYQRTDLETKVKISNALIFRGFWQITNVNKLTYILKHSSDSRFDFRAQIETPTIYPQKGVIKYRLGMGIRENKSREKIISLYGAWKFSRNLGLVFEMDYAKEGLRAIEFTADVGFQKNTVTFTVRNRQGEPLGIILTFTHKFLKGLDAEAFLRLKALEEESAAEVGLRIPF
jgi:hypothetical protein